MKPSLRKLLGFVLSILWPKRLPAWLSPVQLALALGRAIRRYRQRRATGSGRKRGRRAALVIIGFLAGAQVLIGAPAMAQIPIPGIEDCKDAPNPEHPRSGMVGVLDPTPLDQGAAGSIYREYGYAGQVWHTYDLGCGPSGMRNPNAVVDTWTGNQVFNIGKNLIAATNGLHYSLLDGGLLEPFDNLVLSGTIALYDSVYTPLFGLVALFLFVVLFRSVWRGDLATVGRRSMWALAALWFASLTYLTPLTYTHVLDELLIDGTSAVQAGFFSEVGVEERDQLPTLLHDTVIYRNWLRGEFGSATAPQAEQYGPRLVGAQAWTKEDVEAGRDPGDPSSKRDEYKAIADELDDTSVYGFFQGKDGSRMGAGFLATAQAFALAFFQLLAKATILLAQVLLRVLILVGPLIGLIAMIHHEVLRSVGKALGAVLINVIVVAAMAGVHAFVLTELFDPANDIPPLAQLLLAAVVTVIFMLVVKPVRRMWQMMEMSVAAVGGALPAAPSGVLSRLRRRKEYVPTAQDDFWAQVRGIDPEAPVPPSGSDRRLRPEAAPTVVATAERLDRGPAPALAAGRSRTDDVEPVAPQGTGDETTIFVPSGGQIESSRPRRELEIVGGRPVHVVLRSTDERGRPVYDVTSARRPEEAR